VHAREG
jgi:hypothetical protein